MRRRKLIKRIGAASTLTLGASGLATASDLSHARVENARGELETVSLSELRHRQDLPSPDDLLSASDSDVGTTDDCCCDGCTNCLCCIC